MDNLDGNPSAELGVNDLIRDLNRLTFLNDLAADRAQSDPNIFESILLSTLRSIDALLFNIKNLASIPKLVAFSFLEMMTFHKNVVIANINNKVIALGNTYVKVSTTLIRNKVIFAIPKLVSFSFVEMMTFHKNEAFTNFNIAVMAITGAYNETLTTLNRNKVLFTIPKLVAFSFVELMTFHKNVVIAELTHGINSIHAYLTKTSGYVSRYIYSIKNSVSSLEINLPTNSFKLAILRPALSVGLVITLISSLSGVSAIADELNGEETVSVSSEETPTPEVTPTPEPTVGDEVIVEETPAIAAEDVVTETPAPEPSIACATEIALNEDGTPVDPTQVLCEQLAPIVIEAPTNLSYQVLVEGIKLTWDKSVSSVDKYVVNVGPDNRNIDVSADTSELLLTDLNRKAAYSFTVTAISGELQSPVLGPLNLDLATIKFPRPPMNAEVGGLIVKFNNDLSSSEVTALADNGDLVPVELEVSKEISTDTRLVEFNEPVNVTTAQEIADSLEASNSVEFAELDFAFNTASSDELGSVVPNDPLYASKQWSLWGNFGIGIADGPSGLALAYQNSTGLGVTVAVIDTGFTNHPDLEGQFVAGYDFVSNNEMLSGIREENGTAVPYDGDYINSNTYGPIGWDDNPQDPGDWKNGTNSSWHGTHVAGLISALTNNGIGIAGIAPDAKIQPIRAFSWRGGLLSDVIASITWASGGTVENVPENKTPANVINLSFSVEAPCTPSLQLAIDEAVARGSVVVAAAGNSNQNAANFAPGNCNNVITVGAIDSNGERANYSNFGEVIDISAPGGELDGQGIYSTSNEGTTTPTNSAYSVKQGTSIAAAYVSAAIAKLAQVNTTDDAVALRAKVLSKQSVRPFKTGACLTDNNCGLGYLFFGLSALPTIDSGGISPSGGTASGGDTVTITGTGFTGATQVTFGGVAGTSLTIVSDTQLSVVTPVRSGTSRTVGAVPVIITNPSGDSSNDKTFTFRPNVSFSGNGGLVQLGDLASRSQSKSVVRTTSASPFTTSGTDSRSNEPYSFTSTRDYGNSGAYAYESDDRSSLAGTSLTTTRSDSGNSSNQGRTNVITLFSSGGIDSIPVGGTSYNTKDGHSTYGSAFGPEVYSEAFYATSSQAISFDWKAAGGGDDYEIYAYLVALSDLSDSTYVSADHTIIAHGLGGTSDWSTASASIPSNGYYKFRFVNGTYDRSGGLAVGANLYIHNQVTVGLSNVINFTNPGDQIGASGTFSFNVSSTSADSVVVTSSTTSKCTVSTGSLSGGQTPVTVTKAATGTCTLVASQGASGLYAPAQNVTRSFEIRGSATTPSAPTLTSSTGGAGTLTLSFTAGSDGGSPITNYEYSLNNGTDWITISPAVTTSPITLTGISSGTFSQIKIRAINAIGDGKGTASNSRSATVTGPSAPSAPTLNTATGGSGSLILTFTAGSDGGATITNYEYSLDNGSTWTTISPTVTTSPISLSGISAGLYSQIKIRAINTQGAGTASNSESATVTSAATSGGGGASPTPTPTPIPTPTTPVRPNNLINNPLLPLPIPNPPVNNPTLQPGIPNAPRPLVIVPIENLINALKPIVIDLFTNPTPQATSTGASPAPAFSNQQALSLINDTQDKKVVDLPSLVLYNGEYQPSKLVIVDNTVAQIVSPGGGLLNLQAKDGENSVPVDSRGRVQMVRSNNVETEGTGLAPNSEFAVYLFSTPTLLGIGKTDAQGKFFASFPVSNDLPIGDHTLQVNGLLPDGKTSSVSVPVAIVESVAVANKQAMPKTIFVDVNPIEKALKAMYWILIVLALMVFLIGFSYKDRFIALIRRRKDDDEPQSAI